MSAVRFVDPSLLAETDSGPALWGSRCRDCGAHTFPRQGGCPRCTGSAMEDVVLSRTGTLWSFTTQGFRAKPPYTGSATYEPYAVGYVELPGQLIVETRLVETDPDRLEIGMPVELALVPFRDVPDDADGPVHTFAFVRRTP